MKKSDRDEPSHWTKTKIGPRFRGQVEAGGAHGTRRLIRYKAPTEFQGRVFRLDVKKDGNFDSGPGPFEVEYFLYNPFSVFDDQLASWAEVRKTTLIRVPEAIAAKKYPFDYFIDGRATGKTFELSFKVTDEGLLQSIIVVLDETFQRVLECCDQVAAIFLDLISFFKQTPIEVYGLR